MDDGLPRMTEEYALDCTANLRAVHVCEHMGLIVVMEYG
jgi:hypothetical protein